MRGAGFRGANLSGSCFVGANLLNAHLDSAVNLHGSIFCGTRMPDGSMNDSGCAQGTACCPTSTDESAYATTVAYVQEFYPLWFTYHQSKITPHNCLTGPDRVTSLYQVVVAINVDTLYASSFLDLAAQPVIVTVPPTPVRYSTLTLDPYGNIVEGGIPSGVAGTFAITGPNYSRPLPGGVTRIALPLNFVTLIFRADKYSASGVDQTAEAEQFRTTLQLQALCD
jgi:hypothetical protein